MENHDESTLQLSSENTDTILVSDDQQPLPKINRDAEDEIGTVLQQRSRTPSVVSNVSTLSVESQLPFPENVQHTEEYKPFESKHLKTRKDLIFSIKEVCRRTGKSPEFVKKMKLERMRKKSLQNCLGELVNTAVENEIHKEIGIPSKDDVKGRRLFATDMLFKMDKTLCVLAEKFVDSTSENWHGMSITGYAEAISENEKEIKDCFLEFVSQPENSFILEYTSAGTRLFMYHMFPLAQTLRRKQKDQASKFSPKKPERIPVPRPEFQTQQNVLPKRPVFKTLSHQTL